MTPAEKALSETSVIVVCYNSSAVIADSLAPLKDAAAVIVVDNASTDGSAERIAADFPGVTLIRNERNLGYGRAVNQAMDLVETPYALHLNPDAVLPPEMLAKLQEGMVGAGDKCVIAAPLLESPRRGFELSVSGPGEWAQSPIRPEPEGPFCTWFVTGAVWLVRTATWRALGGFDENIFLYHDDFEFCRRATEADYRIVVVPDARGKHLVSQGTTPTTRIRWRKEWNIIWGHLYVLRKYEGAASAKREAWRLIRKHGPKTLFYALVLQRKRFMRDLAVTHAALTHLLRSEDWRPNG